MPRSTTSNAVNPPASAAASAPNSPAGRRVESAAQGDARQLLSEATCRVADFGTLRYLAAVAASATTLPVGTSDASTTAQATIAALRAQAQAIGDAEANATIVQQTAFVRDPADAPVCQKAIAEFYADRPPPTTVVVEPACSGALVTVEATALAGAAKVELAASADRHAQVVECDALRWGFFGGALRAAKAGRVYAGSLELFGELRDRLAQQRLGFEHVVRTWFYLGDIVGAEGDTQRYKELNRARADFYDGIAFGGGRTPSTLRHPVYPASTGIGAGGRDLAATCLAVELRRDDARLLPLESPQQTSACDYDLRYGPHSPKFARAMAIVTPTDALTLISGTASITGSETRYVNDAQRQTIQTLENIQALISPENFRQHGAAGHGAAMDEIVQARVYVKRERDYAGIRAICDEWLGNTPTTYVQADVCRDDLLVEIEGVSISHRG